VLFIFLGSDTSKYFHGIVPCVASTLSVYHWAASASQIAGNIIVEGVEKIEYNFISKESFIIKREINQS